MNKVKKKPVKPENKAIPLYGLMVILLITLVCFFPIVKNGFTNWDDGAYVTQNPLLPGPDWHGIFTQPVVSNYHPVTVLSLAWNYQMSGLNPVSYTWTNLLLHLLNVLLVFLFVRNITGNQYRVAWFTALIFAIHPLHVESVAWISARKDVLYTCFFLISLLSYWRFLAEEKYKWYWAGFGFFILSMLSKPAAIILPLVLFLLDFWQGRKISMRLMLEKLPFFLAALVMGIITLTAQSNAMESIAEYPFWAKIFFAGYGLMTYLIRFVVPWPLSAFHPYPPPGNLGWPVLLAPAFVLGVAVATWFLRKNKAVVFGILFYTINLLLVLQVISIGSTLVSERYTYVPYIGLAFIPGMLLFGREESTTTRRNAGYLIMGACALVFGMMTYHRIQAWRDSSTLWDDVIRTYPDEPIPRGNRAHYLYTLAVDPAHAGQSDSLLQRALEDCAISLKGRSDLYYTYETRGMIWFRLGRYREVFADADSLIRLAPPGTEHQALGYLLRGTSEMSLGAPQQAVSDFDACLAITPQDDNALNNRATVRMNLLKEYDKALEDYTAAIRINPAGLYYLNRSRCYYSAGNMTAAQADAQEAVKRGVAIPEGYKKLIGF